MKKFFSSVFTIVLVVLLLAACTVSQSSLDDSEESSSHVSTPQTSSNTTDKLSQTDLVGTWEAMDEIPSLPNSTGLLQMRFTKDGAFDFLWKSGLDDEAYAMINHGSYSFDGEFIRYEAIDFFRRVLYTDSDMWVMNGIISVQPIADNGLRIQWQEGDFTSQRSFNFYSIDEKDVPDYFSLYPDFNPHPGTVIQGKDGTIELEIFSWNPSWYPGKIVLSAEDQKLIAQGIIEISNRYASGEWPVDTGEPMPDWPSGTPFLYSVELYGRTNFCSNR